MPGELGFDTGPYVNLACFCEQAIEDKDGVLTIVRVIDQVTVSVQGIGVPEDLPEGATVNTTLVVGLKAGRARGRQSVTVGMRHPSGADHEGTTLPVHFDGGDNGGANLILKTGIVLSTAGLYWANVSVNGRLVTRVPLNVQYQVIPPGIQTS